MTVYNIIEKVQFLHKRIGLFLIYIIEIFSLQKYQEPSLYRRRQWLP